MITREEVSSFEDQKCPCGHFAFSHITEKAIEQKRLDQLELSLQNAQLESEERLKNAQLESEERREMARIDSKERNANLTDSEQNWWR